MKKIDTTTRHITLPGANLFIELGFEEKVARRYFAQSLKEIKRLQKARRCTKRRKSTESCRESY